MDHLPRQLTRFVGRSREVCELSGLLADPACRLLTLVGPGGIGKTRLAIETASRVAPYFPDGVWFVPLHAVQTSVLLSQAIADALNLPLAGQADPLAQVLRLLRDKHLLLILDTFEHLVEEPGLLNAMLSTTSGLKLLVTSREVLHLQEEWLYPVGGLATPPADAPRTDWQAYDAVQLFVERVRRVRRDFAPTEEAADIVRICRLVEGMPLALELAADWLRTLTCAEVALEIQRGLDVLATTLRDMPERHRSMRAVFDYSWQRLTPAERAVFARLSVFRGGFRRADAEAVAGATLPTLSALVDRALVRWEPDTRRYQVHELLRQYAAERLGQSPADAAAAQQRHCAHFADLLQARFNAILGGRQKEAAAEIEAELDNVRAAWQWAVAQPDIAALRSMAPVLAEFFQIQSRYVEGADAFEAAVHRLTQGAGPARHDPVLALLLTYQGAFYIRLGRIAEAEPLLREAQALYRRLDVPPLPGQSTDPAFPLGIIALIRGDYATAMQLGEQAHQTSEVHNHALNRELACYLLARAAMGLGDYTAAHGHAHTACEITRQTGDHWFMAYCLNTLGDVACTRGEYEAARAHYEASYAIRQDFNDPEGMAVALSALGAVAAAQGNHAEALRLCEQSRVLYAQIGDRGGLATALNGLGLAALALGDDATARQHLHQALQLALEIRYVPCLLAICFSVGRLLLQTGAVAQGLDLLAVVQRHSASPPLLRAQVQQLFSHARTDLAPAFLARTDADYAPEELDTLARNLHAHLTPAMLPAPVAHPATALPALPEPLSDRELDVLRLIAAGLKNQAIAGRLDISLNTVKTHINNIYGKLGVASRVQAVTRARALGLLE